MLVFLFIFDNSLVIMVMINKQYTRPTIWFFKKKNWLKSRQRPTPSS